MTPGIITTEEFDFIVEERIKLIKKVLQKKAKEYASDTNRMHNFVAGANYDNESPEKYLWNLWKKHLVAVQDIINKIEKVYQDGIEYAFDDIEYTIVNEKITDTVNYAILLEALFNARRIITT